jgi:hypothetical protein
MVAKTTSARYVRPNLDGGWDVIKEGHRRVSAHSASKAEAVGRARELAERDGGGEVRVMNKYGKLVERTTVSG